MYGEIYCDPLPDAPELIKYLCDPTINTPEGTNFRQHINAYNVAVSFGSLSTVSQLPHGVGPPVVKLNGRQSQQIGNVVPGRDPEGRQRDPLFGQVYVLNDISAAVDARMSMPISRQLLPSVMRQLEVMIRNRNPFAQRLVSLGRQLEEGVNPVNYMLSILNHRPATGQVCALFESRSIDPPDPSLSGIWIKTRGNSLKKIELTNRNADWLLFSIMYPDATQTYGRGIPRHSLRQTQTQPPDDDVEFLEAVAFDREGDLELREVQPDPTPVAEPTPGDQEDLRPAVNPVVEPSNWNDDIETTEAEIPANMVQQPEHPFHQAAEFGELRNHFAEDVMRATGASNARIAALLNGEEQCMDANELDAYLCALTRLTRRPSAVVRTSFGTAEHLLAMQHAQARAEERPIAAIDHVYGDFDDPRLETILIPRLTFLGSPGQVDLRTAVGHFTLGVYYPESGELYHFDSLQNPLDSDAEEYYRRVVETLNPPDQRRFHLHAINARPNHTYNRQSDGTSCGFWVAMNAEMVLLRGLGYTHLPNFGPRELQQARSRILRFLHCLTVGQFPDYQPPPPSQCIQRDVRELHRPIGAHVPYNADASIPPPRVAEQCSDEPFIGDSRVDETAYRPRLRGPAKFASRRDYVNWQAQRREQVGKHHPILSYGALTQKYLIYQAWHIFFNEEEYQRRVQNTPEWRRTIRSEFLKYHERNLHRSHSENPSVDKEKIGRIYQMPKTSRQSSKNINLNITRAMAIRKAVNPKCGMFVTFTFNCKCVEIVELIGASANPADYPDLCCRAASVKFRQMLKLLTGPNGLLGPVKAYVWSLEYQKRGNKHWHLVLMNDPDDPVDPNTSEYVDHYISAQIPDRPEQGDPDYDAKLYYYNLVTSLYVHDCADNENAACRVGQPDGKCRFGFPKQCCAFTTVNAETGTVTYARPSPEHGGNSFVKRCAGGRSKVFDNRHVVPHNRVLTLLMGSHVCVEFVTKYSIWFYLFKYNYKLDSKVLAALYVQDPDNPDVYNVDEFNVRRELAFYGPFEAVDTIRSEAWAGRSHDPMLLSVHLEGEEPVSFISGRAQRSLDRVADPEYRSKWTAYMELCRRDANARKCLFEEIERDYTFHKDSPGGANLFEPRRRSARGGMHIGMIYPPSRRNLELFATYLLALELRGIQSFADLRSLNRPTDRNYDPARPVEVCATAIEAAVRRHLLASDETWIEVMEQVGCTIHNSRLFVRFFVTLLLFSQPADPSALLERFLDRLLPEGRNRQNADREARLQQLLRLIQRQLEEANYSMTHFGLPEPAPGDQTETERMNEDLVPPVLDPQTGDPLTLSDGERLARANGMYERLNAQQRAFIDLVFERDQELRHTRNRVTNTILLEGAAGTGKTHTLNVLIELCHARGIPIRACASTGKAATHLLGACTAHSLFGIPVVDSAAANSDIRFSNITANSYKGRLLKQVPIIIIDEVGMLHVDDIYCINMLLKDLHSTGVRFGRVLMIFTGDAKQIMPIVPRVDPLGEEQAKASFFFSADCSVSTRVCLTENMRVRASAEQAHFLAWQQHIGMDQYPHVEFPDERRARHSRFIRVPSRFVRFDEDAFIRGMYSREVLEGDPMQLASRVLLAPVNTIVDRINKRVTAMMPADRPSREYLSVNTADAHDVYDPTSVVFAADNLQSITNANMPVHALTLRVGMPVMCMQNLDVANGICNGTTMIVERLGENVVWCRVNTRFGQRLQPFAPTRFAYDSNGFKFTRIQLPLRVAFAVTVNRAQGGTYDYVAYHSLHQIWAHGTLFVAVTRVTSPDGLTILCDPKLTVPAGLEDYVYGTTRNVVHPWVSGRVVTDQPATREPRPPHVAENADEEEQSYGPEFAHYDRRTDSSAPGPSSS